MFKINSKIEDKFTELAVKQIFNLLDSQIDKKILEKIEIDFSPNKDLGDFTFSCFVLAKKLKKTPVEIAKDLFNKLKPTIEKDKKGVIRSLKNDGPYLNFFVDHSKRTEIILTSDIFGSNQEKKKYVIEYVSPNTNKPLHLGHGRNAFLGTAVANILEENNGQVTKLCLINDRGVHISKSMIAYLKSGETLTPENSGIKGDHFVGNYYSKFDELKTAEPELEEYAQQMLKDWEAGDRQTIKLWKKMNKWVIDGMEETFKTIGAKFDKFYFESDFYDKGKDIVLKGVADKKFIKKDGAIVVNLDKYNLPEKVLIRSNGTSLYITQDIYLTLLKFKKYNPDKIIHVIGSEQDLAQKQLFAIMDILGLDGSKKLHHLSYGMVNVNGGKLKSREGVKVDLDNLIQELKDSALAEIKNRTKNLPEIEANRRARVIALGALKYYILQYGPKATVNFEPEKSLSFTGKTGPYLQYSYARIQSIIKKSDIKACGNIDYSKLSNNEEKDLIILISKFSEVIKSAGEKFDPSILAKYLYDLASSFHSFYHTSPVVGAEAESRRARMVLITRTAEIMKRGLNLLGIEVLDEM